TFHLSRLYDVVVRRHVVIVALSSIYNHIRILAERDLFLMLVGVLLVARIRASVDLYLDDLVCEFLLQILRSPQRERSPVVHQVGKNYGTILREELLQKLFS